MDYPPCVFAYWPIYSSKYFLFKCFKDNFNFFGFIQISLVQHLIHLIMFYIFLVLCYSKHRITLWCFIMKHRVHWLQIHPCTSIQSLLFLVSADSRYLSSSTALDLLHPILMCGSYPLTASLSSFFPELPAVPLIHLLLLSPFVLPALLVMSFSGCQCCQLA